MDISQIKRMVLIADAAIKYVKAINEMRHAHNDYSAAKYEYLDDINPFGKSWREIVLLDDFQLATGDLYAEFKRKRSAANRAKYKLIDLVNRG